VASQVPAVDYIRAQRIRSMIRDAFAAALSHVDVLVSPTTARVAPPIREDAERRGENDDEVLEVLTAFSFAANLTGQPALTVPAGYDESGLPVGLQAIGRWWDEATILRLGLVVETMVPRRPPRVHYRILP